ncbi:MAG: cytochrome P450 [Myxococcales bacterium]|nr:cytochrome P450 [Myxococcales bacterium]
MPRIEVESPAARAAPFIVERVGDVARPTAALPAGRELAHVPGERGVLLGLTNVIKWMRRGVHHLDAQRERWGPVYKTKFGPMPAVCVADPELIAEILRNEDGVWSAAVAWWTYFGGLDPAGGPFDMAPTLDFEPHRECRRLMQPAFTATASAGYLEILTPMLEQAIAGWQARGTIAAKPEIHRLLSLASARMFLGIEREGEFLERAIQDLWEAPLAVAHNRFVSRKWRRALAGFNRLQDALLAQIPARRAEGGKDLFSQLCLASRDEVGLADKTLVHTMIGVLLGAFESSASGITSLVYLLAHHPDWQERLRRELLALGPGRVAYADMRGLDDCELVWKETLRLFPVTGHVPRVALRDVTLGAWDIPAGTYVHVQLPTMMHHPRWWSEPLRFDPERFSPERAEDRRHKGVYLPFGAGAHACIGQFFSGVQAKAFLHALLTRCRVRLERDYVGHHTYGTLGSVSGDIRVVLGPLA